jgi:hypothetical protein
MKSQLTLQIAIQYPEVYGLAWVYSNSAQPSKPSAKAKKNKALRKIIEFAVITVAGLINPEAANWAIPALKLSFMLLDYLQKGQDK